MSPDRSAVVVVTGLSGAGKTTALNALSDLGYYCVDNLPPTLVAATVQVCNGGGIERVALGMDVRVGAFLDSALDAILALQHHPEGLSVLYLDAADDVIVRRFSETRRPHPMLVGPVGQGATGLRVPDGVRLERERLAPIRGFATAVVDTSQMSVHGLRRDVLERFATGGEGQRSMQTRVVSFGFKHGVPLDADLLFDVRFLDNPYFVAGLREQPGTEPAVRDFVLRSPGADELIGYLERLLLFALPRYEREGKSYLTLAIGCTGGRHRSVVVATELADRLRAKADHGIGIVHRDVGRGGIITKVAVATGKAADLQSGPPASHTKGKGETP
ncbi:MAG: RNase adapter RapZ [Deltaproteobacteria bacterium]|nr:MAG: RNase adapter RapZ [Deltaproteobacteria bacterium]